MKRLLASALLAFAAAEQTPDLFENRSGIWALSPDGDHLRWVEIHDLDEARRSGVFHVEVLARRSADPAWKVDHVVPHLAVTAAALRRSVRGPLARGGVYPEAFDTATREGSAGNP
jgi:hypothetical protein